MRVVVLGAGAVGSLLGGRLAEAGHSVLLVGRPAHVAAVRANGLRIENGTPRVVRLDAAERLDATADAECMLLTTKTFDLESAARELAAWRTHATPVLLPQNGLGAERAVADLLTPRGWGDAAQWCVRAVGSVPATWVGPGVVRAAGAGEILLPRPEGAGAPAVRQFDGLLRSAGVAVRTVDDLDRELWRKVVLNTAINPVTALHRVENGALAAGPLRAEALTLLEEGRAAAAAAGYAFHAAELARDFDRIVAATAANRSSMRQDLERGRPTEVDAILGEVLRAGAAHGLALPHVERAAEDLRAAARKPS